MVEGGGDVVEVGLPVLRPGDGRPGHPGRPMDVAVPAGVGLRDVLRAVDGGRRRRRAGRGDDLLEPDRALRRRPVRRRPGRGRRRRADHPRPDPRRGRRRGWRPPTRTAWTGSSWSRRRPPTRGSRPTVAACRGLRLRRLHDGRHRRPGAAVGAAAGELVARARLVAATCRSASGSASPTATRPPRSPGSPTA